MKRIVFMGTPAFSVNILDALVAQDDQYEVVAVVTQPDRPVGRKRKLTPSPVKEAALKHDIPVYQPEKIGRDQEIKDLLAEDIDLIVTAAFGQFLPTSILEAPRYGAVNVHASLLPKYRGGAPVHYAIWNGDKETGVTIMRMVKKMDAGDILTQVVVPIESDDTVATMFDKLSVAGTDLLMDTLPKLFAGEITPTAQVEEEATFSPNITSQQEQIDWRKEAQQIDNQVRAFNAWPVAHTKVDGQRWKIWQVKALDEETSDATPGTIIKIQKKPAQLWVATGNKTVLAIEQLQPAGKKQMDVAAFINGGAGNLAVGDSFDQVEDDVDGE
ncbi:methionyl-tRNA formyltransferase [Aerococcus viridans]|uniref:methionyl-tRNA formyltransferase n=1 Tax=Aerococcus urinaeequi TaxID=51665 RepID=UPI003AAC761B